MPYWQSDQAVVVHADHQSSVTLLGWQTKPDGWANPVLSVWMKLMSGGKQACWVGRLLGLAPSR